MFVSMQRIGVNIKKRLWQRLYAEAVKNDLFLPPQVEFQHVIHSIQTWLEVAKQEPTEQDPVALLDYLIRAVGEDMRTSTEAELVYAPRGAESRERRFVLFQCKSWVKSPVLREPISSAGKVVVASTYDWTKMTKAATHISRVGFQSDMDNYSGSYFPEMGLIVVENGLHHSAAAAQHRLEGEYKLQIFPLSALVEVAYTDGAYWYHKQDPEHTCPVSDVRTAILFELAKLKADLTSNQV